jgi:DNA-binding transcriptional LysR family regulator
VELRHVRYFIAVAEELHLRRAAERLHVAQPAVSEQVRKLELDLGVQVFERTHRSVSLTEAGVALLDEARRVLRRTEVAREAARGATERAALRLRIGDLPDALPAAVPRALRQLTASLPAVQVDLESAPAWRLVDDVRRGRMDAAITSFPAPTNGPRSRTTAASRPPRSRVPSSERRHRGPSSRHATPSPCPPEPVASMTTPIPPSQRWLVASRLIVRPVPKHAAAQLSRRDRWVWRDGAV